MKNYIKSVVIRGLWEVKNINVDFNEDVNILIGGNGSGKTTFLRIVESLLNVDLGAIEDIIFVEVEMEIQNDDEVNKLIVQRLMEDNVTPVYRYILPDGEIVEVRNSDGRVMYRSRMASRSIYQHLKEKLGDLVKVSWLSINRISENIDRTDRRAYDSFRTDVDLKLNILMNQIISYRLQLETKVNERTGKFNEEIVSLLLYNQEYDSLPKYNQIQKLKSYTKEEIITELHKVFSYFGNPRVHSEDIEKHAEMINAVVEKINSADGRFSAEEMLSLSLMNRTVAILGLSADYQREKAKILEPINMYLSIVSQYLRDKRIELNATTSELIPHVQIGTGKEKPLVVNSLSSGEKQLLILLTETLLQQSQPYIFIADEPELSLHIEWQRNLVNSIRSLNPNAQIIFATHAPEIAANHPKKLINMLKVTTYAE